MKRKSFKTGLFTVALVCFVIGFSNAQSKGERPQKPPTYAKLLEKMDANEDGKLSQEEVKGPLKKKFTDVDTNEDGFISEEEFKNMPKPKRRKRPSNK
ncbi:MAG: Ca2+-binding EF-hand superfamily protein [Dokdonia sp.]|jgi:Ca2+-binding EF-hand superfamily protein